jgi:hypothetical protein
VNTGGKTGGYLCEHYACLIKRGGAVKTRSDITGEAVNWGDVNIFLV